MQYFTRFSSVCFLFLFAKLIFSQDFSASIFDESITEKLKKADRSEFRYFPKKPGHYTAQDWRAVIDSTWGEGLSTANKLQLFDYCWNLIDRTYPGFFHIDDKWDSLKTIYRPEVAAGVSRGRFSAIMSRMFSSLTDRHSFVIDVPVSRDTFKPGIPLFVPVGVISMYPRMFHGGDYCHFGASLAPLPDSTIFVYDVVANHPLGLEAGDIVLGYDNIPWKQLYKELLAAELPIAGFGTFGSNPSSVIHGLLTSAGENWHLFDIIDILKYSTGDTVHLPTSLLINQQMQLLSSEQLPVPGVPFPDIDNGHHVSWGIVDGTQTGYIYTWSWMRSVDYPPPSYNAGDEFLQALQILINDYQIDGLIIDSRFNNGGFSYQYMQCLSVLFNEDQFTFSEWMRDDPNDHYSMKSANRDITGFTSSQYLFDLPIAMLTGPHSVSCGDFMPLQMREHPMVRTFGLGTNSAFGHTERQILNPVFSDWDLYTTDSNFTYADQPGQYLTHLNIPPDEEIWFTQVDAVKREDTVVKRAIEWIQNLGYSHNASALPSYVGPGKMPVQLTAEVENPNDNPLSVLVYISNDSAVVDSVYLTKDGAIGDNLWGATWLPAEEDVYHISVKTNDPIDSTTRILPKVAHFTSVGPVVIDNYNITSTDTIPHAEDKLKFEFTLKNNGQVAVAKSITARVYCLTSGQDSASIDLPITLDFGDINPGEYVTSTRKQYIKFSDSLMGKGNVDIPFRLEIASGGRVYWTNDFKITDLEGVNSNLPKDYILSQNYPNPFNNSTKINYQLPNNSLVELSIYNLLGQKMATVVSANQVAGSYTVEWDASNFPSGLYLYRIQTDNGFTQTKKLILMK